MTWAGRSAMVTQHRQRNVCGSMAPLLGLDVHR